MVVPDNNLTKTSTGLTNQVAVMRLKTSGYNIENSGCVGFKQKFRYQNNLWQRFKRLLKEDFYIVECTRWETLSTLLNIFLFTMMLAIFIYTTMNGWNMKFVNENDNTSGVEGFNTFNKYFNYIKNAITVYVFILQGYAIYKRTTKSCHGMDSKVIPANTNGNPGYTPRDLQNDTNSNFSERESNYSSVDISQVAPHGINFNG